MYVQLPGSFTFAEALVEAAKDKYIINGSVPHIVTIESASEEAFLFPYYYNYFWIGAQDVGTPQSHDFRFVTGPNVGQQMRYFGGWMRGQPDSSGNTCLMDQLNVEEQIEPEWALVSCDLKLWILLEYEGACCGLFVCSGNMHFSCSLQHARMPRPEHHLLRVRTLRRGHIDHVDPVNTAGV